MVIFFFFGYENANDVILNTKVVNGVVEFVKLEP